MNLRIESLRTQRSYSWNKEGWFAPLEEALEGIDASDAAWIPANDGNTIWQIVNHLNYWNNSILTDLKGGQHQPEISNDDTFGEPGNPKDATGWKATVDFTKQIIEELQQTFVNMTDYDLDAGTLGDTLYRWTMHDVYHTGQIIQIRKQQGSWPKSRE